MRLETYAPDESRSRRRLRSPVRRRRRTQRLQRPAAAIPPKPPRLYEASGDEHARPPAARGKMQPNASSAATGQRVLMSAPPTYIPFHVGLMMISLMQTCA